MPQIGVVAAIQIAAVALSVGSLIATALTTHSQHTENTGSRLGDLSVTSSTYGTIQPFGYGTVRTSGNIIWALPVKEEKNVSTVGGGGKGGKSSASATNTTFSYFGNFAVALAKGPADRVLKIWMDSAIVYDQSAGTTTPADASLDNLDITSIDNSLGGGTLATRKPGLKFRFYPGDETQLPDSLIEADKGVGNVPAFRGTCYIVFEDLALESFSNRIPTISVELAFASVPLQLTIPIQRPAITVTGVYTRVGIAVNPLTLRGYVMASPASGFADFDLTTMQVIGEHKLVDIMGDPIFGAFNPVFGDNTLLVGFDQLLYAISGNAMFKINPNTWKGTYRVVGRITPSFQTPAVDCVIGLVGLNGLENFVACSGGSMPSTLVCTMTADIGTVPTIGDVRAMTPGRVGASYGKAYVLSVVGTGTGAVLYIQEITVTAHAGADALGNIFEDYAVSGVTLTSIQPDQISGLADGFDASTAVALGGDPSGLVYDVADDGLVFQVTLTTGGVAGHPFLVKYSITSNIVVWATEIVNGNAALAGAGAAYSNITDGRYAKMYGSRVVQVNTANGVIISDLNWADLQAVGRSVTGQQIYDDISNSILVYIGGGTPGREWTRIPVDRANAVPSSLEEIFTSVCRKSGMSDSDFDATQLSDISVPGFLVTQRTSAADILKPLCETYQVDAIETNWVLSFVPRGGEVIVNIPEDYLVRTNANSNNQGSDEPPEPYKENRVQEVDIPERVTITYADIHADNQTNTQQAKRIKLPEPTMFSSQQTDIQIAITMDADTAAQLAERILYDLWINRHTFEVYLPRDFLYLDPTDVVTLTLNTGYQMRGRIGPTDVGVDSSISTTIYAENDGQYVSTAVGQPPLGPLPPEIPLRLPSALFMLDVPLLRDTDDALGLGTRVYSAASSYNALVWPGALVQGSPDSSTWTNLYAQASAATWGYVEDILPDAVNTFPTQFDQSVNVVLIHGGDELESVPTIQLSNGFNAAVIINGNGDTEVIQFRDVEALGSNRYKLSVLRRGLRGTDTMAKDYQGGEIIVMLHTTSIQPLLLDESAINKTGFYRAITNGSIPESALIEPQIFHGRDQMPYAPVHVAGEVVATNIELSWVRRTRVGGFLRPGTADVPLSENSEEYQIDIYNAAETTIIRTITGIIDATEYTYSHANIITDFGTIPSQLHLAVYQLSSTVGRGFGRIDTITITSGIEDGDIELEDGSGTWEFDDGSTVEWA